MVRKLAHEPKQKQDTESGEKCVGKAVARGIVPVQRVVELERESGDRPVEVVFQRPIACKPGERIGTLAELREQNACIGVLQKIRGGASRRNECETGNQHQKQPDPPPFHRGSIRNERSFGAVEYSEMWQLEPTTEVHREIEEKGNGDVKRLLRQLRGWIEEGGHDDLALARGVIEQGYSEELAWWAVKEAYMRDIDEHQHTG